MWTSPWTNPSAVNLRTEGAGAEWEAAATSLQVVGRWERSPHWPWRTSPVSPHVGRRALRENLEMENQTVMRTKIDTGSVGDQTLSLQACGAGQVASKKLPTGSLGASCPAPLDSDGGERTRKSPQFLPAYSKVPRSRWCWTALRKGRSFAVVTARFLRCSLLAQTKSGL